ncbi:Chromatin-associated protein swi6 [Tolypocladium ophioglossoides CBS 100239]|uniref:Chromatin-associated protein swi6 n=1 Tax=Tolypocladium ophioglossoides (strain CBS 100239) TaxID=1163406 RepID=A0A0L0N961_TOLOC|nr:Chromatin-associated protein swi6 [Tolypocladium ophioglossoides CBS 100239]
MARRGRPAKLNAALSDDEASDLEPQPVGSWRNSVSASDDLGSDASPEAVANGADTNGDDEGEDEDEDEDEEEVEDLGEDEFIVEAIKKHMVDEDVRRPRSRPGALANPPQGSLKFLVKWEGWEKKTDLTWEPEDNLMESASEILEIYFARIGGRDKIFKESDKAARGKKRSRASSGALATKRSRKNGAHPADSTPPATSKKWSPPAGSWEDEIESIDACEDEGSGKLVVYLIWKNGRKTRHETSVIYKKCPQKMLQFYERHVKIIRDESRAAAE